MKTNDSAIKKIAKTAYPDYAGRKFFVEVQTSPFSVASYWDGGSRDYFVFVDLRSGRTMLMPPQSAYDKQVRGADSCILPEYCACVRRRFFCGKDCGLTVILPSQQQFVVITEKELVSGINQIVEGI